MSLAALFCTTAAFSPISWLEYYSALEVPYMALSYVAFRGDQAKPWRSRVAVLILAAALTINLGTRLFEPALCYGAVYFGSLLVLAAVLTTTCGRSARA